MQPFRVRDAGETVHEPSAACPACAAGYPQPCGRMVERAIGPGSPTRCAGMIHAELGAAGVLETRCAACGVPP